MHPQNIGLLPRDYTALCPTKLSSSGNFFFVTIVCRLALGPIFYLVVGTRDSFPEAGHKADQ
jgi:hypothetical protein